MKPGDLIRGGSSYICLLLLGSAWLAVITGRSVECSVILISNRPPPLPFLIPFSSPLPFAFFFFYCKNHGRLVGGREWGVMRKIPFDDN